MKMYKWLLFDADGTLFDFDKAESYTLKKTFEDFNITYLDCYLTTFQIINADIFKQYELGMIGSEEMRIKRFKLLFKKYGLNIDSHLFSAKYLRTLSDCSELLLDSMETIKQLAQYFKLLIITNGIGDVQRPRYTKSDLNVYFSGIVISDEVGASKPGNKIFDAAFLKMGNPEKDEVLIIGDSLSSDIAGGINYGIDTCWFNPEKKEFSTDLNITYEINNIQKLVKLLIQ
jgi:2-haloacid dehalogenase